MVTKIHTIKKIDKFLSEIDTNSNRDTYHITDYIREYYRNDDIFSIKYIIDNIDVYGIRRFFIFLLGGNSNSEIPLKDNVIIKYCLEKHPELNENVHISVFSNAITNNVSCNLGITKFITEHVLKHKNNFNNTYTFNNTFIKRVLGTCNIECIELINKYNIILPNSCLDKLLRYCDNENIDEALSYLLNMRSFTIYTIINSIEYASYSLFTLKESTVKVLLNYLHDKNYIPNSNEMFNCYYHAVTYENKNMLKILLKNNIPINVEELTKTILNASDEITDIFFNGENSIKFNSHIIKQKKINNKVNYKKRKIILN